MKAFFVCNRALLRKWESDRLAMVRSICLLLCVLATGLQTIQAQTALPFKVDFETPSLGKDSSQIISPYIDEATGVTFTAEAFANGSVDEVIGLVKNRATSACVDQPDNQKLGTGRSIFPKSIGLSDFPIRATFPQPLARVTISVEFQTLAGQPVRLRLFNTSGIEVASVTELALPADGTCGFPGAPRARKTVSATSTQAVAYAEMDVVNVNVVFVIDNFEVKASAPPKETTFGPPGPSNPSGTTSEPINTATGNYYFQRTDFVIPGLGLPIIFARTYNAQDTSAGPLGHGWAHNYNILLTENSDSTIVIKQGDGKKEFYDLAEGGTYRSIFPGVFNTLRRNPDSTFTLTYTDQTRHHFGRNGKLTNIIDRNENVLSLTYNNNGDLITLTEPAGRTVNLSYDALGHINQITDPIGRTVRYNYDDEGNLVSNTDPKGGVIHYNYDEEHRVIRITDQRGNTLVENTYDKADRVLSQKNGRGFVTTFAYGVPQIGETSFTDPRGNTTIHTHDSQLRLIKETDPLNKSVLFAYDSSNNRTAFTDKNGNITRLTYNERGNFTSMTNAMGSTNTFTYDINNNLTSITDARGFTATFQYDSKGNLILQKDPLGHSTTFVYDKFGQIRSVKDAGGKAARLTYDKHGNLIRVTDALGGTTRSTYDNIGRPITLSDPKGNTTTAEYDANNQVVKIVNPLGHTTAFAFDAVGNLTMLTNAKGNKTRYDYDKTNNLTTVTDALGHVTRYKYDANNNLIGLTDATSHTTTYTFDALNRQTAITEPLGNSTAYTYDPDGNVTAVENPNGTKSTFTYDAHHQLIRIASGDGLLVSYTYDVDGNRVSMEDQRGTTKYIYNALSQIIKVTHPKSKIVSYDYDESGNLVKLTYPDGRAVTYNYDFLHRLIQVKDWKAQKTKYAYDAAGNLKGISYPNNTSISYSYDAANQLLKVTNKRYGNILAQFSYKLDKLGNRVQMTEHDALRLRDRTASYTYDAISQLIHEEERHLNGVVKRTKYTYDPVGNRLSLIKNLSSVSKNAFSERINYTYDANNRLLRAGSTTYTYDANGNRLKEVTPGKRTLEYAYNTVNNLTKIIEGGRIKVQYMYDGDQNKVEQIINVASGLKTIRFLNDVTAPLPVALQQEIVTHSKKKKVINYVYGSNLISEEVLSQQHHGSAGTFFYHHDGLGSTVAITDRYGKPLNLYQYNTWGNIEKSWIQIPNRFLFIGEEQDQETDLHYMRARWYDAKVGRFLTRDPLGGSTLNPLSINRYAYVLNNPVNFIDPSGQFTHKRAWRGIKSIGKAVQNLGEKAYKGAQAVARNPYGAFAIRIGFTLAGAALGGPYGAAIAAAGAEFLLAGLRGEFACRSFSFIFGRALIAGIFAGTSTAINPSIINSLWTLEVSSSAAAFGATFVDELTLGVFLRGLGAAAGAGLESPKNCNQGTTPKSNALTWSLPSMPSGTGAIRGTK